MSHKSSTLDFVGILDKPLVSEGYVKCLGKSFCNTEKN